MKIVQINIRGTQGGAGRVAYDLHSRLSGFGHDAKLLYGYASGIQDDEKIVGRDDIQRTGTRSTVLANFLMHRLAGREFFTGSSTAFLSAIEWCDVIHLHAIHHYFVNWQWLLEALKRSGKPVVATAHDWWFLTGRCGFVEDCKGWQRGCGECGSMRTRDLPSIFDFSRQVAAQKRDLLNALGNKLAIVCPSQHLAHDHMLAYPDLKTVVIRNGLDADFEAHLERAGHSNQRDGYLFSASDLSSPGKIDAHLVDNLKANPRIHLKFVGRNGSADGVNVKYFGEVRDRATMVSVLNEAKALVFCSLMDNAPLTIIEALAAGLYVLAYRSPAADEIIEVVGGRTIGSREEMLKLIEADDPSSLYGGMCRQELAGRAKSKFGGDAVARAYERLYRSARDVTQ